MTDDAIEPATALGLYRTMFRIRICEESFVPAIESGEVRCPVHLCSGQEAVAAGVCAALTRGDYAFGSHRSHGHYLAMGGDLSQMVAEIYCKSTGCAKGRGGSMHVIAPEVGMLGAAPIVAGTISLAVGAAFAATVRGETGVSVAFFGDGAAGEGVLFESLNLAAVRKLPVIFVCENNLYSTHMPIRDCRSSEEVRPVADAFGVWSRQVDGNDVLQVHRTALEAAARCRSGMGPAFLECLTYRLRGHVGADDNIQGSHTDIRPRDEIEAWRARDPLPMLRATLLQRGVEEARLALIEEEASAEVEAAVALAKSAPFPSPEELDEYVFQSP